MAAAGVWLTQELLEQLATSSANQAELTQLLLEWTAFPSTNNAQITQLVLEVIQSHVPNNYIAMGDSLMFVRRFIV
jgi:hypothetical protein